MTRTTTILAFVALSLFGVACGGTADRVRGGEEFEGWRQEEGMDVFYMRISGSASQIAKESGEEARMRTTCIESTKVMAADTVIRKLVGEQIEGMSSTVDGETRNQVIISMRSGVIRGTEMKECGKLTDKWSTCECVHFVKGQNLKQKFKLQVEKALKEAGA